jgi:hypothetical protein
MRITRGVVVAALGLVVLSGCGDGRLNARGRILKGGAPFTVPEEDYIRVTFFPVTENGTPPKNTYAADFNGADGTFRAAGPDGRGIPPGKYRVALEYLRGRKDLFKGAYDGDRSPYVFDVSAGMSEMVIDVAKRP